MDAEMKNDQNLYPLLFEPVYKDYVWGGNLISAVFHRTLPPGIYAESWEVSAHPDGMSVVANGWLRGSALADAVARFGARMTGTRTGSGRFPLLIKLIDAADRLSVQVHPDEEAAAKWGGEAKTEMWYVLEAADGAAVYAGLQPGTDRNRFRSAIARSSFDGILTRIPVRRGDAIFVPGGRVHAIDRGCLILEVQQNSNTTYRVFDWGRVGQDGKPRPLHVEQALRVMRWDDNQEAKVIPVPLAAGRSRIYQSPYFRMEQWTLAGVLRQPAMPETFQVLFCTEGAASLMCGQTMLPLPAGASCLIPAEVDGYELQSSASVLLQITVPNQGPSANGLGISASSSTDAT
jgi:mannose-6-phosphate isomerase